MMDSSSSPKDQPDEADASDETASPLPPRELPSPPPAVALALPGAALDPPGAVPMLTAAARAPPRCTPLEGATVPPPPPEGGAARVLPLRLCLAEACGYSPHR